MKVAVLRTDENDSASETFSLPIQTSKEKATANLQFICTLLSAITFQNSRQHVSNCFSFDEGVISHDFANIITDIILYPAIASNGKDLLFAVTLLSEEDGLLMRSPQKLHHLLSDGISCDRVNRL